MNSFCMNCGIELPEGASFCPKCGAKVEAPHCPSCGKKVDFGADFCIYCGHPLTEREEGVFTPAESPELNPPPETLNTPPAPVQPVSEIPPVLAQPAREVPRGDDVQEFSWSYFKLGFTNFSNHRYNIIATLTKEKLHIAEQRRWGWKPKTEETDIALVDITEFCIRSKASAPYWFLYSALATTCLFAIYAGVLNVATCVILALVVGVSIWVASFNLLHNEFVILTRDNKKTVLKGAKEAVFQQLEQGISSRTGVRIGEPQSAALTIFISISVGIIATGAVLLLLGDRTVTPAETFSLTSDELIGRWDLQYMENDGVVYSFSSFLDQGYTANEAASFFHSTYIQFFEDGSLELTAAYDDNTPEQIYGTWVIEGNDILTRLESETVKGYLRDNLFCIETETTTARFQRVSTEPTKTTNQYESTDKPGYGTQNHSEGPATYTTTPDNPIPTTDVYGEVHNDGTPGWMNDPYNADNDDPYWIKNLKDYLRLNPTEMVGPAYTRLMEENDQGWNRLVTEYLDVNNLGIYTNAVMAGIVAASNQAEYENPHCETSAATVFFGWYDGSLDMIEIDIIWHVSIPYYDPAFASTPVHGYYYAHALVDGVMENIDTPEYCTAELTEAYFYNLTGI